MQLKGRGGFFGALSALFKEEKTLLVRPPYAALNETFDACKTCEAMCVVACEEKIIRLDGHKTPFLDFKTTGCSDCHKCLDVCTPNVLNDPQRFISGHAKISMTSCMSHHETICFTCKEPCLENAIVFKGMFHPIILPEKCTGCGYCIAVCPSAAIEMVA
ncbi:MAG: 4Fe-4S binding protein [Sulfuricurvum sp.]|nr:4Fe-4S binding protein [Sulfuricurvum sp.]MDD5386124.1 4Fe-4S binding protein [Sulfuricurvum sp.]